MELFAGSIDSDARSIAITSNSTLFTLNSTLLEARSILFTSRSVVLSVNTSLLNANTPVFALIRVDCAMHSTDVNLNTVSIERITGLAEVFSAELMPKLSHRHAYLMLIFAKFGTTCWLWPKLPSY